jgi:hypothetical protein
MVGQSRRWSAQWSAKHILSAELFGQLDVVFDSASSQCHQLVLSEAAGIDGHQKIDVNVPLLTGGLVDCAAKGID